MFNLFFPCLCFCLAVFSSAPSAIAQKETNMAPNSPHTATCRHLWTVRGRNTFAQVLKGMQALLQRACSDFTSALTTAIVVRGASTPCPACVCSPELRCPPLECHCPSGPGQLSAPQPSGWPTEFVVLLVAVSFSYGVFVGGFYLNRGAYVAPAAPPPPPRVDVQPAVADLAAAAAAQAQAFRR